MGPLSHKNVIFKYLIQYQMKLVLILSSLLNGLFDINFERFDNWIHYIYIYMSVKNTYRFYRYICLLYIFNGIQKYNYGDILQVVINKLVKYIV